MTTTQLLLLSNLHYTAQGHEQSLFCTSASTAFPQEITRTGLDSILESMGVQIGMQSFEKLSTFNPIGVESTE